MAVAPEAQHPRPLRRCGRVVREFLGALVEDSGSAFRWMLAFCILSQCGGILLNTWSFFWFQDVVAVHADGFSCFGWKIASTAQGAVSYAGVLESAASCIFGFIGGYAADAASNAHPTAGRQRLLAVATVLYAVKPVVFAATGDYTVVLVCTLVCAAVAGVSGAANTALTADVMPHGPDGVASNAARDMQLFALGFTIPATVLPLLLGNVLDWFGTRQAAYTVLFLTAAVTYGSSAAILQFVQPHHSVAGTGEDSRFGGGSEGRGGGGVVPAGALCCDRLCFRAVAPRVGRSMGSVQ